MGRARSDTAGVVDPDSEVELTAAESRSVRRRSDRDDRAVRVRGGTPVTPIGGPEDVDPRRHPRATAIGLAVAYQFVAPEPPRRITITTGSDTGAYYAYAQRYAVLLAAKGYTLADVEKVLAERHKK